MSLRPRRLQSGDRLAVVAPASPFTRAEFDGGMAELVRLGFEPVPMPSVFDRDVFVAGTAEARAADLRRALSDPSLAGIIAVRGGYGSAQLLPWLDPQQVRAAAKPFIGYSDTTALLTFFTGACDLVAFHGPMLAGRLERGLEGYHAASFLQALGHATPMGELTPAGLSMVAPGEHRGVLLGGTVTQLLASLGTPWAFAPPPGYILFFDEVRERPYRLDRMLTQLSQSGLLQRAGAVVVGELPGCDEPEGGVTATDVLRRHFASFPGPVIAGFPSGHTTGPTWTLPFGVAARVVAQGARVSLVIEEPAVQ